MSGVGFEKVGAQKVLKMWSKVGSISWKVCVIIKSWSLKSVVDESENKKFAKGLGKINLILKTPTKILKVTLILILKSITRLIKNITDIFKNCYHKKHIWLKTTKTSHLHHHTPLLIPNIKDLTLNITLSKITPTPFLIRDTITIAQRYHTLMISTP